jgi:hypothetical protein
MDQILMCVKGETIDDLVQLMFSPSLDDLLKNIILFSLIMIYFLKWTKANVSHKRESIEQLYSILEEKTI